ncbi:MAG TPA: hypothetical protein ENJ08_07990 [Gammaproteobacteria bacterium]|nr:hypothetical protein [Gammaproteobacteria bacterium]
MAKTDFSSSSPLAGSFLTGHIHPVPRNVLLRRAGLYPFIYAVVTESRLCGCFTLHGGFFSSAFFASVNAHDNEANMS